MTSQFMCMVRGRLCFLLTCILVVTMVTHLGFIAILIDHQMAVNGQLGQRLVTDDDRMTTGQKVTQQGHHSYYNHVAKVTASSHSRRAGLENQNIDTYASAVLLKTSANSSRTNRNATRSQLQVERPAATRELGKRGKLSTIRYSTISMNRSASMLRSVRNKLTRKSYPPLRQATQTDAVPSTVSSLQPRRKMKTNNLKSVTTLRDFEIERDSRIENKENIVPVKYKVPIVPKVPPATKVSTTTKTKSISKHVLLNSTLEGPKRPLHLISKRSASKPFMIPQRPASSASGQQWNAAVINSRVFVRKRKGTPNKEAAPCSQPVSNARIVRKHQTGFGIPKTQRSQRRKRHNVQVASNDTKRIIGFGAPRTPQRPRAAGNESPPVVVEYNMVDDKAVWDANDDMLDAHLIPHKTSNKSKLSSPKVKTEAKPGAKTLNQTVTGKTIQLFKPPSLPKMTKPVKNLTLLKRTARTTRTSNLGHS